MRAVCHGRFLLKLVSRFWHSRDKQGFILVNFAIFTWFEPKLADGLASHALD